MLNDVYGPEKAAKIKKEVETSKEITKKIASSAIIGSSHIPLRLKKFWEANLNLINKLDENTVQGTADIISLEYGVKTDLCKSKIDSEKEELYRLEENLDANVKKLQRVTVEITEVRTKVDITKRRIYEEELRLKRNYELLEDAFRRKLHDINVSPK